MMVVLGHFEHPLARHVAAAEHIFQKRNDIVRAIGTAEGDDENSVVSGGGELEGAERQWTE